jgi:NAD(P)-dependent dehydrogenase (short-subunit alcohol dehydrogenase family)
VLDVNLTGAFLTARAFARRMSSEGPGGRIILTSSLFGLRGGVENSAYSASKFGMIGLMQCLAAELAPRGVLVNCVCPGQMDTAMIRQLFRERAALKGSTEEAVHGALASRIPLGHLGALDELAGTYVFLASDLSRYVTGQSIVVDGGWQVG